MLADFCKHRFLLSLSPAIPTPCGGVHKMKVTTQPVPLRPERAETPSPGHRPGLLQTQTCRPERAKALKYWAMYKAFALTQGDLLIAIIPRAMPWARSYWAFSPYLNHMRKFCKMIYTKQKAMPANSCKHRFYFYILFPKILLPESLPEGKDFFYPKLSYMMLSGSTPRESR